MTSNILLYNFLVLILTCYCKFNVECISPPDNPFKAKIIANITSGYK